MASRYVPEDSKLKPEDSVCSRPISSPHVPVSDSEQRIYDLVSSSEEISKEDREKVLDWLYTYSKQPSEKSIRIITVGESGVGKSALLNALIGTTKFKEAKPLFKGATDVEEYVINMQGIKIIVYDCPGLKDGTKNEVSYLQNLKEKCPAKETDLLLYCMRIDEPRKAGHTEAIKITTEYLGRKIWKYALVVLTFANIFETECELVDDNEPGALVCLERQIQFWKTEIQTVLRECGVKEKLIEKLQFQPAGHPKDQSLPGRNFWLSDLWGHVLLSMRKRNQAYLVQLGGLGRGFQSEDDVVKCPSSKSNSPIVVTSTVKSGIAKTIGVKGNVAYKLVNLCNIL